MGLLSFLKSDAAAPIPLPRGSFTIDKNGRILTSTIPRAFPEQGVLEIGTAVLKMFLLAQKANLPCTEMIFNFSGLKLTAKELRGGAIVFLSPREPGQK